MAFNLASGTITGPGVGTDTLTNIEGIVGTNFVDTFDATGFTGSTGVPGTPTGFNEFEGMGGDDTITSSTNSQGAPLTRVSYLNATAAVTVDLQAKTADGNGSVGHDTFVGNGVANVLGSAYDDMLFGSNNPERHRRGIRGPRRQRHHQRPRRLRPRRLHQRSRDHHRHRRQHGGRAR